MAFSFINFISSKDGLDEDIRRHEEALERRIIRLKERQNLKERIFCNNDLAGDVM